MWCLYYPFIFLDSLSYIWHMESIVKSCATTKCKTKRRANIADWASWYRWYARSCQTVKTNAAKRRRYHGWTQPRNFLLSLNNGVWRRRDGWASIITSHAAAATERLIGLWIRTRIRTDVRRLQVISAQAYFRPPNSLTVDRQQLDRGKWPFQRNSRKSRQTAFFDRSRL